MHEVDPRLVATLRSRLRDARGAQTIANALGIPRNSLLAVLAGTARVGTVHLALSRARALGWLDSPDPDDDGPEAA